MKNLVFSLVLGFFCFGLSAQSSKIDEALDLLNSYWKDAEDVNLEKATVLINDFFKQPQAKNDQQAMYAKAQLMLAEVSKMELSDQLNASSKVIKTFGDALALDKDRRNRDDLLRKLYDVKRIYMDAGRTAYEQKAFDDSYAAYSHGLTLNEIETKYPRYANRDISIVLTAAYLAQKANDTENAIKLYEEVIDHELDRKDAYDSLAELYVQTNQTAKAEKIKSLKLKRYGE